MEPMGPMDESARVSQDRIELINKLKGQGLSMRKIAKEVGVRHGTVAQYITN